MAGDTAHGVGSQPVGADRATADECDAVRVLYEQYARRVRAYCRRRLGNPTDAEDAVQETFLKAQKGLHRFDRGAPVWPWLVTIASRVCTDIHRAHGYEADAELGRGTAPEPFEHAARRSKIAIVDEALRTLPDHYRNSLYMRHFEEWSYEDIARSQGTSIASVKSTLMRGRRRLGARIESLARADRQWPLPSTISVVARRIRDRVQTASRELGRVLQGVVGVIESAVSIGALVAGAPAAMVAVGALSTSAPPLDGAPLHDPTAGRARPVPGGTGVSLPDALATIGDGATGITVGYNPRTYSYYPPFFTVRTPEPAIGSGSPLPNARANARDDDEGGLTVTVDLSVRTTSVRFSCTDEPYVTACNAVRAGSAATEGAPDPGPGVGTTPD